MELFSCFFWCSNGRLELRFVVVGRVVCVCFCAEKMVNSEAWGEVISVFCLVVRAIVGCRACGKERVAAGFFGQFLVTVYSDLGFLWLEHLIFLSFKNIYFVKLYCVGVGGCLGFVGGGGFTAFFMGCWSPRFLLHDHLGEFVFFCWILALVR